jgi:hypothetical protein
MAKVAFRNHSTVSTLLLRSSEPEAGGLHVVDVGARPDDEFVFMAHPEGRRPSAKLRALAGHLRAVSGDPPYWDR